jgi:hypothetical protein
MNIKDFSQPTILTGKQYGTTVTIELDHSDTSIDEVMDGMLTIVKGLGYLDSTINEWIKDKAKDVYDDEHTIVKNSIADDFFSPDTDEDEFIDSNTTKCYCGHTDYCDCGPEDEDLFEDDESKPNKVLIDAKKQYDLQMKEDEDIDWDILDERRMDIIGQNGNDGLHYGLATDEDIEECQLNDRPHFNWDETEFDDYGMRKIKPKKMDKSKVVKGKIKDLKK